MIAQGSRIDVEVLSVITRFCRYAGFVYRENSGNNRELSVDF